VPTPSGRWQRLSGNQLGALLADARLAHVANGTPPTARPLALTSVVTTPLIEAIARSRGVRFERTLTGFKWLWTAALALERAGEGRFGFACEEALGYSLTPVVRDKDGISAAVAIADLAARCREHGQTLLDRLHALAAEFGVWASAQHNVSVSGRPVADAVSGVLDRAAADAPSVLGARQVVSVRDYRRSDPSRPRWLAAAPLVELELTGGRILLRPSGTEPKLKFYVDLRAELPKGVPASAVESALAVEAAELGRELVEKLGLG
jgi:phosphomannomutase